MRLAVLLLRAYLFAAKPWLAQAVVYSKEDRELVLVTDFIVSCEPYYEREPKESLQPATYILRVDGDLIMPGGQKTTFTGDNAQVGFIGNKNKIEGGINQNQALSKAAQEIDLTALASELQQLRLKLAPEASKAEHYTALGKLAEAEESAQKGDRSGALENIKKAGSWLWGFGEKIAVGLAVQAAKSALGL